MSEDKDKAPQRIYMHPTSAEANVNPWPFEPGEYVEYVRQDLVATKVREAREEAFKDACDAMRDCLAGTMSSAEFHRGFEVMRKLALRALERAADSREGEDDESAKE